MVCEEIKRELFLNREQSRGLRNKKTIIVIIYDRTRGNIQQQGRIDKKKWWNGIVVPNLTYRQLFRKTLIIVLKKVIYTAQ